MNYYILFLIQNTFDRNNFDSKCKNGKPQAEFFKVHKENARFKLWAMTQSNAGQSQMGSWAMSNRKSENAKKVNCEYKIVKNDKLLY